MTERAWSVAPDRPLGNQVLRLSRFAAVGASGVVVATAVLWALVNLARLHPLIAMPLAVETSILTNFAGHDRWTFRAARARHAWPARLLRYQVITLGGMALSLAVMSLLSIVLGVHYLLANVIALGAASGWNYAANTLVTWSAPSTNPAHRRTAGALRSGARARERLRAAFRLGRGPGAGARGRDGEMALHRASAPPHPMAASRLLALVTTARTRLSTAAPTLLTVATWLAIAAFVVVEVAIIRSAGNGPFMDEGIFIAAGLRTLEGHGISDNYLTWFAGSLLWPGIAGLAFSLGGLTGMRLAALVLTTISIIGVILGSRNLFGRRAAFFTALTLPASGPVLMLAHLGAYDLPAIAGLGSSFWAITEFGRRGHRAWLVLAALSFSVAIFGKYPVALSGVPLALLIVALRGRRAWMDLAIFAYIVAAVLLMYYLPLREQLSEFLRWRVQPENNPSFATSAAMVRFSQFYYAAIPALLALAGWTLLRGQRAIAAALLLGIVIWPAYHILINNPVGDTKHAVFGFLLGYPLIGALLAKLSRTVGGGVIAGLLIAGLLLFGSQQRRQLERSWPDVRPAARYLLQNVQPGERLLISNAWPYVAYLYGEDRIRTPWDVYDVYRVENGQNPVGLCEFDWFVDEYSGYEWPGAVRDEVMACGTFEPVFSSTSKVTALGSDLKFFQYTVRPTVWRNVRGSPFPPPIVAEPAPSPDAEGAPVTAPPLPSGAGIAGGCVALWRVAEGTACLRAQQPGGEPGD